MPHSIGSNPRLCSKCRGRKEMRPKAALLESQDQKRATA